MKPGLCREAGVKLLHHKVTYRKGRALRLTCGHWWNGLWQGALSSLPPMRGLPGLRYWYARL